MIGWKILCLVDGKEVIAEVVSQPLVDLDKGYTTGAYFLVVYHDTFLKTIFQDVNDPPIKVIERA
jgi:hypothetical protein